MLFTFEIITIYAWCLISENYFLVQVHQVQQHCWCF